jgi:hypothetical protein
MWYREAVTRVDPSGQINMDFPDIKPKPFDIENSIQTKLFYDAEDNDYRIKAYINDSEAGSISFEAPDNSDTAKILFIEVFDFPDQEIPDYLKKIFNREDKTKENLLKELKAAGYDVDNSSVSRYKWGIGKKLYQEFYKFIMENKPNINYVDGSVHSKDTYDSRVSVFGLPVHAYDLDQSAYYKINENESSDEEQKKQMSQKISNEMSRARFNTYGEAEIPAFSNWYVKNKIDRKPKEESKPGGLIDVV